MPTSDCREAERSESCVEVVLSAWARPLASAATVCWAPAWFGLAARVERSLQNVESWADSPSLLGSGKTASMEVITWFVSLARALDPLGRDVGRFVDGVGELRDRGNGDPATGFERPGRSLGRRG